MKHILDHPKWGQAKKYETEEDGRQMGFVYGIFNVKDELLYIGKTTALGSRMSDHEGLGGEGSYGMFIEVPMEKLDDAEAEYVFRLLPPFNRSLPKGRVVSTLDAYQKIDLRFCTNRVGVIRLLKSMGIRGDMGYFKVEALKKISDAFDQQNIPRVDKRS